VHLISKSITRRARAVAQSTAIGLVLGATAASANTFEFLIDDLTDQIVVTRNKNGVFDLSTKFAGEVAQDTFILSGTYRVEDFPINFNIVGPADSTEDAGEVSDTLRVEARILSAGFVQFSYSFTSDIDPGSVPRLPSSLPDIPETGALQTVLFILGDPNSDTATIRFRSDVSPIPGPIVGAGLPGLILAGGALLVLARRRRFAGA
jgi:hypothetical protein